MIKNKFIKIKKGFTLIELIIVIAIIGILTAIIFTSMANVGVSNELKNNGRQLAAAIRLTQDYALTGKTKEDVYPCVFKFSTDIIDGDYYYKIEYIPRKVNEGCGSDDLAYEIFEGPVRFDGRVESMSLKSVSFSVPHGLYIKSSDDEEKTEFVLTKKGKEYKVTIFSSGLILEGDELQ